MFLSVHLCNIFVPKRQIKIKFFRWNILLWNILLGTRQNEEESTIVVSAVYIDCALSAQITCEMTIYTMYYSCLRVKTFKIDFNGNFLCVQLAGRTEHYVEIYFHASPIVTA